MLTSNFNDPVSFFSTIFLSSARSCGGQRVIWERVPSEGIADNWIVTRYVSRNFHADLPRLRKPSSAEASENGDSPLQGRRCELNLWWERDPAAVLEIKCLRPFVRARKNSKLPEDLPARTSGIKRFARTSESCGVLRENAGFRKFVRNFPRWVPANETSLSTSCRFGNLQKFLGPFLNFFVNILCRLGHPSTLSVLNHSRAGRNVYIFNEVRMSLRIFTVMSLNISCDCIYQNISENMF